MQAKSFNQVEQVEDRISGLKDTVEELGQSSTEYEKKYRTETCQKCRTLLKYHTFEIWA